MPHILRRRSKDNKRVCNDKERQRSDIRTDIRADTRADMHADKPQRERERKRYLRGVVALLDFHPYP